MRPDLHVHYRHLYIYLLSVAQGLYFGGSAVDNHGIVTLDEIMNTESTALLCITPAVDCCTAPGSADWFSPSGSVISTATSSATYQVKGSFYTNLRRSSGGLEGIYRCDIRLSVGAASTSFYVGVYRSGDGNHNAVVSYAHCFVFTSASLSNFRSTHH